MHVLGKLKKGPREREAGGASPPTISWSKNVFSTLNRKI